MKISLDGGALCIEGSNHFGNYTFTQNIIESVKLYDPKNDYFIYSFCEKPGWLSLDKRMHFNLLKPKTLWLSTRISLEEIWKNKDIFLALNQAIPLVNPRKVISFSHGLSFYFFPQYYSESFLVLKDQLDPMVKKSSLVIVPSKRVKTEMAKLYPNYANFKVLNYGVPNDMLPYSPRKRKEFFVFAGMNHGIKNIDFLVKVFKKFKSEERYREYKLFLIGNLAKYEDEANGIFVFSKVGREEIRKMYAEATAYLTASFYESFNFPVLEALAQNCSVIGLEGAIIPEFSNDVFLATGQNDFLEKMREVANGKKLTNKREDILKRFSWKKYIAKLIELYR